MGEELIIKIGADSDAFQAELAKITKQTKNLENQLASIAKISGAAFIGLTATIGVAVIEFAKFENGLLGVKTLLDESSFAGKTLEEGFKDLRKEALSLAAQLPIDVDKVNKALFDTVSAGVAANKAVAVVATAAKLAVAGLTDVSIATDGLTTALNAYGFAASESDKLAAKFFTAQKFGKTTIAELAGGLGLVAATAKNTGVSFDELLAATAAVTTAGVRTKAAFTGLNAVIANISKPTKEAQEEAARLGIEFNLTALQAQGFEQFMRNITEASGLTTQSIANLFGSIEAQKIAFSLTGAQAEKFSEITKALGNDQQIAATFTRAFNEQQASLSNTFVKLKGTIQVALIQIGERFAPAVALLTDVFAKLVGIFNANPIFVDFAAAALGAGAVITGLITVVALLALAYIKLKNVIIASNVVMIISAKIYKIQTFLSTVLGKAQKILAIGFRIVGVAIRFMLGPWGILIAVITLLALAFRKEIKQGVQIGIEFFAQVWAASVKIAIKAFETFMASIRFLRVVFTATFSAVLSIFKSFAGLFKTNALAIGDVLRGILTFDLEQIKSGLDSLRLNVVKEFEKMAAEAAKKFNEEFEKGLVEEGAKVSKVTIPAPALAAAPARADAADPGDDPVEKKKKENAEILLEDQKLSEQLLDLKKQEISLRKQLTEEEGTETRAALGRRLEENAQAQQDQVDREAEILQRAREDKLITEEEFNAFQDEMRDERTEEQRQFLIDNLMTEQEIRDEAEQQRLNSQIEANNQFLKNQEQFGKAFATINEFINSSQVQGAKSASGELVALQRSSNSTLKSIGKAAAVAQIIIKTAESAMNIYAGFSTIPIIGPALGIAGAAAAIAFGAEQLGAVGRAQTGGRVAGGRPGVDSVPFLLAPGELITPEKNFEETVNAVADKRISEEEGTEGITAPGSAVIEIRLAGDVMDFIEAELVERTNLDISITKVGAG